MRIDELKFIPILSGSKTKHVHIPTDSSFLVDIFHSERGYELWVQDLGHRMVDRWNNLDLLTAQAVLFHVLEKYGERDAARSA